MNKRIVLLALLIAVSGFAAHAGERASGFDLPGLNSGPVRFDPRTLDRPFILAFWMSHCPYCLEEFPRVAQFYSKNRSKVGLIGISLDSEPKPAQNLAKKAKFPYPNVWDRDFKVSDAYGVNATPTYILVGKDGTVVRRADRIEELEGVR